MGSTTKTYSKDSSGRSLVSTTTRYDTGGRKTVTRESPGLFSSGKLVSVTKRK